MSAIKHTQAWAPWWVKLMAFAFTAGFAVVIARSSEGARLLTPLFALTAYWALAVLVNSRVAEVSVRGVTVRYRPIPIRGATVQRQDIVNCYSRVVVNSDHEDGSVYETFYTAGVLTTKGVQVDVFPHFAKSEDALAAAYAIARTFDDGQMLVDINTGVIPDPGWRKRVFAWMGIVLLLLGAGAAWEFWG